MAWCCQASSHYLSQCWPRPMSPHGIVRPQWVNDDIHLARHINPPMQVGFSHGWRWRQDKANSAQCDVRQNKMCIWVNIISCWTKLWWDPSPFSQTTFSITIQIQWKFHLTVILFLAMITLQILAHAMKTVLLRNVPKFFIIDSLIEPNEISMELWWKIYNGPKLTAQYNNLVYLLHRGQGTLSVPQLLISGPNTFHGRLHIVYHLQLSNRIILDLCLKMASLTHCGLMTSYGNIDLGQHWLR